MTPEFPEQTTLSRRGFVRAASVWTAAAMASPALAVEPFKRKSKPNLKAGLAAYSFRQFFGKSEKERGMTMETFIDYCAAQGLEGGELTSYYFPKKVTGEYLNQLKRHAHIAGVDICGGAIGNDFALADEAKLAEQFELTRTWIDHYADLGAPVIRVFAGGGHKGLTEDQAVALSITGLEKAGEMAGKRGVMLGVENHGYTVKMGPMFKILEAVKSPWVGVNLDTGNIRGVDDPYAAIEKLAPYAVNVQVKVEIPIGGKQQPADFDRIGRIIRDSGYSGYVVLEYEAAPDPYAAVPRHLEQLRKALKA